MSRSLASVAVALTAMLLFAGDPLRPFGDGRYYGYLIRAGLY